MTSLKDLDTTFMLWVNHFAGQSVALDKLVYDISDCTVLKGGLFVACYWWLWQEGKLTGNGVQRRDVVVAIVAGLIAVIVSRVLQLSLPFHQRPLHTPNLGVHLPFSVAPETLNTFSSFPSDHAVLFFALCVPLWARSRWLGAAASLWTMVMICLPRIYLGYHWPSDVAAGAIIGTALMLGLRPLLNASRLPGRILKLETRHPVAFYTASWIVQLELAVMFYDARHFALDFVTLAKMLVA